MYLGTYPFEANDTSYVEIKHTGGSNVVTVADAVSLKFEKNQVSTGVLSVTASVVSDETIKLEIVDSIIGDKPYWLERILVSTGRIEGFLIPKGTTKLFDTHNLEDEAGTYTYRIRQMGDVNYNSESTVSKAAKVSKSRDILVPMTGYKTHINKVFFIKPSTGATSFDLINVINGTTVLTNQSLTQVTDPISGNLLKGEFSQVETEGYYRIRTNNNLYSTMFPIGDMYNEIARVATKHLSHTRFPKHALAKRQDTNEELDMGMGHEDAWDMRHWTSYNDTLQPFALMEMFDNDVDVPLVEEELKWGLGYLLKIQERNPNGSGVMKFGQIFAAYMILPDGGVPANTIVTENVEANGLGGYSKVCEHVISHYLYAYVLSKSSRYFQAKDPTYALQLRTQALSAYSFMDTYDEVERVKYAESRSTGDYFRAYPILNYCFKVLASVELHLLTDDTTYLTKARTYMNKIVDCQLRNYSSNNRKVTGYFMKDEARDTVMRNRIHAGIPLFVLARALTEIPNISNEDWFRWYASLQIYMECYVKRFTAINQYNILPYGFGVGPRKMDGEDTINYRFFQGNESSGGESDGNTKMCALHASSLFEAAYLTEDKETEELAYRHMEWVFGKNHFGTPLMAGVGEVKLDRTKIFTHGNEADSFEAIGACVNGIDGEKSTDEPRWTNGWQTGETWGINRAWIQLAIASLRRLENKTQNTSQLTIESIVSSSENISTNSPFTITATIKNNGNAGTFPVEIYAENATINTTTSSVTINSGATATLTFDLTSSLLREPYVVAVMLNNNRKNVKSVVGYVE